MTNTGTLDIYFDDVKIGDCVSWNLVFDSKVSDKKYSFGGVNCTCTAKLTPFYTIKNSRITKHPVYDINKDYIMKNSRMYKK